MSNTTVTRRRNARALCLACAATLEVSPGTGRRIKSSRQNEQQHGKPAGRPVAAVRVRAT